MTIMSEWQCTEPHPDEEHLKALWQSEIDHLQQSLSVEQQRSDRWQTNMLPLFDASKLSETDLTQRLEEDIALSNKVFEDAELQIADPPFDVQVLHEQEQAIAEENAGLMEQLPESTSGRTWQGSIWGPFAGGWGLDWEGEAEEMPVVSVDVLNRRIDAKAQAFGESYTDGDYSMAQAFLSFHFAVPSWGHLTVYASPWMHGGWVIHADDQWWKEEYAIISTRTWMNVHQNYWRGREYNDTFRKAGSRIAQWGRTDQRFGQFYSTNVVPSQIITVQVGVNLYCYGRAAGGRASLDFRSGSNNYILIPGITWRLTQ